jgi:hypothetical protein
MKDGTAEKSIHPTLLEQLMYWQDRAANLESIEQIERAWAFQMKFKYDACREVGFGKLSSFIMVLKCCK